MKTPGKVMYVLVGEMRGIAINSFTYDEGDAVGECRSWNTHSAMDTYHVERVHIFTPADLAERDKEIARDAFEQSRLLNLKDTTLETWVHYDFETYWQQREEARKK